MYIIIYRGKTNEKKQGISLIVLVITLIVMIILAAAVIVTLNNAGIINKANDAVDKTNLNEVQQLANAVWAEEFIDGKRGDTLKAAVLDKLTDYTEKYNIIVDDKGVTVEKIEQEISLEGKILKGPWEVKRVVKNGKVDYAYITNGKERIEIGSKINYTQYRNIDETAPVGEKRLKFMSSPAEWFIFGADEQGRILMFNRAMYEYAWNSSGYMQVMTGVNGSVSSEKLTNFKEVSKYYYDGTIGVASREVRDTDINQLTGYDPTKYNEGLDTQYGTKYNLIWENDNKPVYYVNGNRYTLACEYPYIYFFDLSTCLAETIKYEKNKEIGTITQTNYKYNMSDYVNTNSKMYEMLGKQRYLIGTPITNVTNDEIEYGYFIINSGNFGFYAYGSSRGISVLGAVNGTILITLTEDLKLSYDKEKDIFNIIE